MRMVDSIENECWFRLWGREVRLPCRYETGFQPVKAVLKKAVMATRILQEAGEKELGLDHWRWGFTDIL